MKQAILISIQPKWLVKILNGEKTIDIRKTMPKCELPIDVYVYCTQGNSLYAYEGKFGFAGGKSNNIISSYPTTLLNGKVVAKFTLRKSYRINTIYYRSNFGKIQHSESGDTQELCDKACLTINELLDYRKGKPLYAWHIEDLVIFDEPMELSEFGSGYGDWVKDEKGYNYVGDGINRIKYRLTKAPQSWQYVYVEESQ